MPFIILKRTTGCSSHSNKSGVLNLLKQIKLWEFSAMKGPWRDRLFFRAIAWEHSGPATELLSGQQTQGEPDGLANCCAPWCRIRKQLQQPHFLVVAGLDGCVGFEL